MKLSMAKHNREATIISMILGFTCLALFLDGLRILGIIPPFMHLDINVIDQIKNRWRMMLKIKSTNTKIKKMNPITDIIFTVMVSSSSMLIHWMVSILL